MLAPLLSMLLAVPYPPVLQRPAPDGWLGGPNTYFGTADYADDAGVAPLSVRLQYRREDAGYGTMEETLPYAASFSSTLQFPGEGDRWCWRARHVNAQLEVSDPSAESCFRTDFTPPQIGFVDAGPIVSDGPVTIDMQPATDALSGVQGYYLELAPVQAGPFDSYGDLMQLPLQTFIGEGTWFGVVRVYDNAWNDDHNSPGQTVMPITITAAPALPAPEAPEFERSVVNDYGGALRWDAGWMPDAGVTHVVASYCKLDAGCEWRHGFHGVPVTDRVWLQMEGEGPMVARLAVVIGGQVGPWSPPSVPIDVDRTAPGKPGPVSSLPSSARMGPLSVSWGAATDDFTGVAQYVVELTEQVSGRIASAQVSAPTLTTTSTISSDGRYQVRVAAVDLAGNQGEFSTPTISVIDGTGPRSQRPVATASAIDGGALVGITWMLPVDALSSIVSMELRESMVDGGSPQVISVTGLAASRTVPPGQWHWELRATDSLGNVGFFSDPSNVILVTAQGVVNGPAVPPADVAARCGEPLSSTLVGHGDEPRTWSLVSGPQGLAVSSAGELTWTPPSGRAGTELVQVQLSNPAGAVTGEISVVISCDSTEQDAGMTQQTQRSLLVGCGCSAVDPLFPWVLLGLLLRRRMSHP